jgi:hypothetical protein
MFNQTLVATPPASHVHVPYAIHEQFPLCEETVSNHITVDASSGGSFPYPPSANSSSIDFCQQACNHIHCLLTHLTLEIDMNNQHMGVELSSPGIPPLVSKSKTSSTIFNLTVPFILNNPITPFEEALR